MLDERTVRFDFKRANAELPLIVGGLPVFSRKWGVENGKAKPFDQIVTDMPIGSGPYRIGPVNFGKDITYERDPDYWAKDLNVRRGLSNFDRITYKIYKDNTAQTRGLQGRRVRLHPGLHRPRMGARLHRQAVRLRAS